MAGTPFSTVYDSFSLLLSDYRLTNLYNTSLSDYEDYLEGWLVLAIDDFYCCNQSLAYSSSTFTETLSTKNINILAKLMKKYWLEKEVNDVTQFRLHVTDHDFKLYSEAQNLTAKKSLYNEYKEEISQLLVDYSLVSNDWANWLAGIFFVP
jgi:hypothetical protein